MFRAFVELIFIIVIAIPLFIFWLWMLVDCLKDRTLQGAEKIVWVLVIIFLHSLGALIYFFVRKYRRA